MSSSAPIFEAMTKVLPEAAQSLPGVVLYLSTLVAVVAVLKMSLDLKQVKALPENARLAELKHRRLAQLLLLPREAPSFREYERLLRHRLGAVILYLIMAAILVSVVAFFVMLFTQQRNDFERQLKTDTERAESKALAEALELTRLGISKYQDSHGAESLARLLQAADRAPTYQTLMNLGYVYLDSDPNRASAAFRKAIDLDSSQPSPWINLAIASLDSGRTAQAQEQLDKAESLNAVLQKDKATAVDAEMNAHLIRFNRCALAVDLAEAGGSPDQRGLEACRLTAESDAAVTTSRSRASAQHNYAILLRRAGRNEESRELFKKTILAKRAISASDSLANSLIAFGEAEVDAGKYESAREAADEAVKIASIGGFRLQLAVADVLRGRVANATGSPREAKQHCEDALNALEGDKIAGALETFRAEARKCIEAASAKLKVSPTGGPRK